MTKYCVRGDKDWKLFFFWFDIIGERVIVRIDKKRMIRLDLCIIYFYVFIKTYCVANACLRTSDLLLNCLLWNYPFRKNNSLARSSVLLSPSSSFRLINLLEKISL